MAPLMLQHPAAHGSPQLLVPPLPPLPLLPPLPPRPLLPPLEKPDGQLATTTAPCTDEMLEAQLAAL